MRARLDDFRKHARENSPRRAVAQSRAGRRVRQMHAANEPIREWMSVPFIAHAHHLPASVLFQAIGVRPRQPYDRRSVRHIARDLNRPVPEVMAQIDRALEAAEHPPGGQPR